VKTGQFLFAFLALETFAVGAEPKIAVQVHLCEWPADANLPRDIRAVLKTKGVDAVTFPKLITRSGKATKASVTREFKVAGKGKFQTGVVLWIRPALAGERFRYSVDFDHTEFEGFAPRSATKAPIFTSKRIVGIDGTCGIGEVIWLDLGVKEWKQSVQDRGRPDRIRTIRRKLIAILSFSRA
jgi:hypothetical protein